MKTGDPQLPDPFRQQLRERLIHNIRVPDSVDDLILKKASIFARSRDRRGWAGALALVATLALVALVNWQMSELKSPDLSADDVNRDGAVNILDALALARVDNVDPGQVDALVMSLVKVGRP